MLVVGVDGSRKWVLRLQANGKRRDIGLGSAASVSLAQARDSAESMRQSFKNGGDPVAERRKKPVHIPTFREAALMVHAEHAPTWKNAKHGAQWLATLEAYAFRDLGDLPVSDIEGPMIRDLLAEIWLKIPETARRVRQRIATVLDFAHANGWRATDAPMRAVNRGLPKQRDLKKHFAAMPWQELPAFVASMGDILRVGEVVRLALEFTILTAARSGEVRGMVWQEVDLDTRLWVIPGARMKAGRAHRVPLCDRAFEIIKRMGELRTGGDLIFEGVKSGRPLSDMTLTMPLRRAGLGVTVHGFRSAFRDWCSEATNTPREIAEAALAHAVENATEAAYARTDHLEKRRVLMDQWGQFVCGKGAV